jgi:serine protease Do
MSIGAIMPPLLPGLARIVTVICAVLPASPSVARMPELGEGKVPTLAPLVRDVTPSVVNISVQGRVKEDNPLDREVQGIGSGVIVDAHRGYVLTANHVIAHVSTVQVTTKDGRRFVAKLVGRDPATDVAVLRLQGVQALKDMPMGNSDTLEVGDFVIAVGNPFGLGQTVTTGIISALGRIGLGNQGYDDFIQTDAPINPGNSGGALVNMRGELVGINTAIFSTGGGNIGIGFAVPINMARSVMEQIVQHGHVQRGRIGVSIKELPAAFRASDTAEVAEGAVIAEVSRGSPAEQVGIQKGDIVVAADGTPIRSAARLRNKIGLTPIGQRLHITLQRKGVVHNVSVEVARTVESTGSISFSRRP